MNKPKVGFIRLHNSCRSQMAEALGKHFAGGVFVSFSGGTETKPQINQDVAIINELRYRYARAEKQADFQTAAA